MTDRAVRIPIGTQDIAVAAVAEHMLACNIAYVFVKDGRKYMLRVDEIKESEDDEREYDGWSS